MPRLRCSFLSATVTLGLIAAPNAAAQEAAGDGMICPTTRYQLLGEHSIGSSAIRPKWPQSGSWLDRSKVVFAWEPAIDATVELSRSRFFFTVDQRQKGVGTAETHNTLNGGIWFWRVRLAGAQQTSATWSFRVAPHATPDRGGTGLSVGIDFDGDGMDDTVCARDLFFGSRYVEPETREGMRTALWSRRHEGCPVRDWGATPPDPECGTITESWPAGDFNGDGHADVVSIDFDKNLYVYLGRDALSVPRNMTPSYLLRDGRLATYRDHPVPANEAQISWQVRAGRGPGTPSTIVQGDMNGDGYADISDGWYVLYGAADAEQVRIVSLDWKAPVAFASGCDVNGDRFIDVAVLSRDGTLRIYFGSEIGLETTATVTIPWVKAAALASVEMATTNPIQLADVDNDGQCDVVSMFPLLDRPALAELLTLPGRSLRSQAPKVIRHYWHRTSAKGSLSWVVVPRGNADKFPAVVVYDTAPLSVAFRTGVLEGRRGLLQDTQRPRVFEPLLDDVAHHYELYIRGDVNGDGRLDIADNEIMHSFYGGVLSTRVGGPEGSFEHVDGAVTWGGPEQGFFVN